MNVEALLIHELAAAPTTHAANNNTVCSQNYKKYIVTGKRHTVGKEENLGTPRPVFFKLVNKNAILKRKIVHVYPIEKKENNSAYAIFDPRIIVVFLSI